jgi:hypothetical protein
MNFEGYKLRVKHESTNPASATRGRESDEGATTDDTDGADVTDKVELFLRYPWNQWDSAF